MNMKGFTVTLNGLDLGVVTDISDDPGNTVVVHEFIGGGVEVEDCGSTATRFNVTGAFIGSNALYYRQQINNMRKSKAPLVFLYLRSDGDKIMAKVAIEKFSTRMKKYGVSYDLTLVAAEEENIPIIQRLEVPDVTLASALALLADIQAKLALLTALSLANSLSAAAGKVNTALNVALNLARSNL